jgi:hypothetical protein
MSSFFGILFVTGIFALMGLTILTLLTWKYYWGERGKPLPIGEERRKAREEELRLRAQQIEHSKNNPIMTRKPSFWDNTKVYR